MSGDCDLGRGQAAALGLQRGPVPRAQVRRGELIGSEPDDLAARKGAEFEAGARRAPPVEPGDGVGLLGIPVEQADSDIQVQRTDAPAQFFFELAPEAAVGMLPRFAGSAEAGQKARDVRRRLRAALQKISSRRIAEDGARARWCFRLWRSTRLCIHR